MDIGIDNLPAEGFKLSDFGIPFRERLPCFGEMKAVDHLLLRNFDICTLEDIRAAIVDPCLEYEGKLISGKIAGFDETEYFKQIDDTVYFKHYTNRPMMA